MQYFDTAGFLDLSILPNEEISLALTEKIIAVHICMTGLACQTYTLFEMPINAYK